jgi:hypothetical protein
LLATALFGLMALVASPEAARADTCQPENIVLRAIGATNPTPESQDPKCIVLKGAGCQNLADTTNCTLGIVVTTDRRLGSPLATTVTKVCDYPLTMSLCYINP